MDQIGAHVLWWPHFRPSQGWVTYNSLCPWWREKAASCSLTAKSSECPGAYLSCRALIQFGVALRESSGWLEQSHCLPAAVMRAGGVVVGCWLILSPVGTMIIIAVHLIMARDELHQLQPEIVSRCNLPSTCRSLFLYIISFSKIQIDNIMF